MPLGSYMSQNYFRDLKFSEGISKPGPCLIQAPVTCAFSAPCSDARSPTMPEDPLAIPSIIF